MLPEMFVFKGRGAAEPEKFGFRWKGRGEQEQMLLWSTCGHRGTGGLVHRSGDSHGVTGLQTSHGRFAGEARAPWASRETTSQGKKHHRLVSVFIPFGICARWVPLAQLDSPGDRRRCPNRREPPRRRLPERNSCVCLGNLSPETRLPG